MLQGNLGPKGSTSCPRMGVLGLSKEGTFFALSAFLFPMLIVRFFTIFFTLYIYLFIYFLDC